MTCHDASSVIIMCTYTLGKRKRRAMFGYIICMYVPLTGACIVYDVSRTFCYPGDLFIRICMYSGGLDFNFGILSETHCVIHTRAYLA